MFRETMWAAHIFSACLQASDGKAMTIRFYLWLERTETQKSYWGQVQGVPLYVPVKWAIHTLTGRCTPMEINQKFCIMISLCFFMEKKNKTNQAVACTWHGFSPEHIVNKHTHLVYSRLVPGHRPGPKQRPAGWSGDVVGRWCCCHLCKFTALRIQWWSRNRIVDKTITVWNYEGAN